MRTYIKPQTCTLHQVFTIPTRLMQFNAFVIYVLLANFIAGFNDLKIQCGLANEKKELTIGLFSFCGWLIKHYTNRWGFSDY